MLYDLTEYGDSLNKHHKKNYWTKEEDIKLTVLVAEEGTSSWVSIARKLPGRSGKQCRERWYNNLDPSIKTTQWTAEEDALIIQLHTKMGNKWSQIARNLGSGRPSNSVKNRWHSYLKRKCGSMADSSPSEGEKNEDFCTPPKRRLSEPRIVASPYIYESPSPVGHARCYSPRISSTPIPESPVAQSPNQRLEYQFKENYLHYKQQPQPQHYTPPHPMPRPFIPDPAEGSGISPSPNRHSPMMDTNNANSPNPSVDLLSMLSPDSQRVLKQILQIPNETVPSPYTPPDCGEPTVTSSPNHSPFKSSSNPPPKLSHKAPGSYRPSRYNIKPIPFNISEALPSSASNMAMNSQLDYNTHYETFNTYKTEPPNHNVPPPHIPAGHAPPPHNPAGHAPPHHTAGYYPNNDEFKRLSRRIKFNLKPNSAPKETYSAPPPVTVSPIKNFSILPDLSVPFFYGHSDTELWYPLEGERQESDEWNDMNSNC